MRRMRNDGKKITDHPAYLYAAKVVDHNIRAPEYVRKQCRDFISTALGENPKYCINEKRLRKIDKILKVLKMAKGPSAGKSIYRTLSGYQWLLIVAVLCTVHRDNPRKRRYETAVLEIARKNGKTFVVGLLIMLLFYLEPEYSRFFSVAPDGKLAREIKEALEPIIRKNSDILEPGEFELRRDFIRHKPTRTVYTPLNFSNDRMDGKEPNVFVADEVGALPTPYPVEAMKSGQLLVENRLGFIISTKYPTVDNPFEDEVDNAKNILDGVVEDETVFALLYEPDETKNWMKDDNVLADANPLALEQKSVWDYLIKKRGEAIRRQALRENFLTKHCNIIYQGKGTESYVSVTKLQESKKKIIVWKGKTVYVGMDLAESGDNCAVAVVGLDDDNNLIFDVMTFIPEGRIDEKSEEEHVDYRTFIDEGKCIACGDMTVDYGVIEEYVFGIEEKYGVVIDMIGYDRYNAMSSAQKLEQKYDTVQVRQHSDTLHPAIKFLWEKIMNAEVAYTENKLLEINFQNARCVYDTNLNRYISKKKSNGKIDMVFAILDALYLLLQQVILNDGFVCQT